MALNNGRSIKFVYELPYPVHRELCQIMDQNDKWEELAGIYMKFNMREISSLRRQQIRSPTEELLGMWGQKNHTIHELFVIFSKMQHHQAMLVLKPFIDRKYHILINEGEENLSRLLGVSTAGAAGGKTENETSHYPLHPRLDGRENYNLNSSKHIPRKFEDKLLNVPPPEKKQNNVEIVQNIPPSLPSLEQNLGNENEPTAIKVSTTDGATSPGIGRPESGLTDFSEASNSSSNHQIPYMELYIATNQWDTKNILGRGGFGIVFRGTWKNTLVAIKRIEQRATSSAGKSSHQAQLDQSYKELKFLNTLRQDNILPLYGFSVDGEHPCLVYQLMANGSLEDRLQRIHKTAPLTWELRYKIAHGTARGLQFLHTRYDKPLIHGDIKSANILLDGDWTPRIGDFGLVREGPVANYTHMDVTSIHGTKAYLPPDYLRSKQISTKVDTYSFGIVLFEIATGRKAGDKNRKPLRDVMREPGDLQQHMDKNAPLDNPMYTSLVFHHLITTGQKCTASHPKERPEMPIVYQELENLKKQLEIVSKAQIVVQSPSPCPSNPIELQMWYEAQRQTSPGLDITWNGFGASNLSKSPQMEVPINRIHNDLKVLKVDIPNPEVYLTPRRYMLPSQNTQQSPGLPSMSPSILLPESHNFSTPSTLPTSHPLPNMGFSPNTSYFPYPYSPIPSRNSNLQPPYNAASALSPLLQDQSQYPRASNLDFPLVDDLAALSIQQVPEFQQPQMVMAEDSTQLPNLSILGIGAATESASREAPELVATARSTTTHTEADPSDSLPTVLNDSM